MFNPQSYQSSSRSRVVHHTVTLSQHKEVVQEKAHCMSLTIQGQYTSSGKAPIKSFSPSPFHTSLLYCSVIQINRFKIFSRTLHLCRGNESKQIRVQSKIQLQFCCNPGRRISERIIGTRNSTILTIHV